MTIYDYDADEIDLVYDTDPRNPYRDTASDENEDSHPVTAYTTWGPVRGGCGHRHRTYATAHRCVARDHAGCALTSSGLTRAYSDREVIAIRAKNR